MDKKIFYGPNETLTTNLYNTTIIYIHNSGTQNGSVNLEYGDGQENINNYWALLAGLLVIGTAAGNILGKVILLLLSLLKYLGNCFILKIKISVL